MKNLKIYTYFWLKLFIYAQDFKYKLSKVSTNATTNLLEGFKENNSISL